jgi:flagellar export protein FliJ
MKAFRFRGDRLLGWRRHQEDAARAAFLRASESAREFARRAAGAAADVERSEGRLHETSRHPIEAGAIVRHWNWIAVERKRAAAAAGECDRAVRASDEAAAHLRHAATRVRMLERLRERAWQRYQAAERSVEMKNLNELATLRYARRQAQKSR